MEDNKDIFDQFRDGQSAWETPPPPSAWERLEARLDTPPPPENANPWKPFVLPGLGMLCLFFFLGFQLVRGWTQPVLKMEPTASARPIAQANSDSGRLGHLIEDYESDLPVPALEDTIGFQSENLVGKLEIIEVEVFEDEAIIDPKFHPDEQYIQYVEVQNVDSPLSDLGTYFPVDNVVAFDYDTTDLRLGNMVVTNDNGNVIDTVQSLGQYVNAISEGVPGYLQMNTYRNDIGFHPRGNNRRITPDLLEHFNYLLGSWKYKGPSASSFGYEEWDRVDDFNLEGRGFLVLNGDTVVTERMRIEQKGDNVYYIVALDTNQTPMRFRLRSRAPGEAVFRKSGLQSKEEIILRSAGDRLETVRSNGKQNPAKRSEEIRNLERSE